MTTTAKQLLGQVMTLDEGDRVEVADMLLESVAPRTDPEYVDAWSKEIAARIAAHESGEDKGVDWEVLRAELLSDEDGDE
jgi:putative addiction module component (TIGR02574 family)